LLVALAAALALLLPLALAISPPAADARRREREIGGGCRCCMDGTSEAYWSTLSTVMKRVEGDRRRRGIAAGCWSRESVT
jgi:hypothetical protein